MLGATKEEDHELLGTCWEEAVGKLGPPDSGPDLVLKFLDKSIVDVVQLFFVISFGWRWG